jgi:glutaminyl-tRNA synthetase
VGDRFQFQRLGYFNVDSDASAEKLVFNKTVGLRDTWAKQEQEKQPETKPVKQNNNTLQPQRKAIDVIQQLGKKYTNLPEAKQLKAKEEIQQLANEVSFDELQPLFNTATKKVGTRIATIISLGVLLKNGLQRNADIEEFINNALEDSNLILVKEAQEITF